MHPLRKLTLNPGVNTEATQTLNSGSWSFSNLIRWFMGYLQKMGGWQRITNTPLTGISRGLHAYEDLNGIKYLASGSAEAFQIYTEGTLYNLQTYATVNTIRSDHPALSTSTLAQHVVFVNDPDNPALSAGDKVYLSVPASIGGVCLLTGAYNVTSSVSAGSQYSVDITDTVTSSETGGVPPLFDARQELGTQISVTLDNNPYVVGDTFVVNVATTIGAISVFGPYTITSVTHAHPISPDFFTIEVGAQAVYSAAHYSAYELQDSDGEPQIRIAYATGIPSDTTTWSIDNFGSTLLACFTNGPLFYWSPPIGSGNLALQAVITAPSINRGMFVAMPQAQVMAYGCSVGDLQDPLLVYWSDAGNYTNYTASSTNQAGSYRLSRGSLIVGGRQAPQVSLLWTDLDLWSAQYVGTPFIYSFNIVQMGCGLIAQRAHTVQYGQVYWMSQKQFFTYGSGGVSMLPCAVWDKVFNDLDANHVDLICAASNAGFNEVMWFYPSVSGGTGEIDSYVKYNTANQLWDYGKLDRTSWIDQSVMGQPIGADLNLLMQQHEIGYDADGEAMAGVFVESGFLDLGEGSDMIFVDQLIPDFNWFGQDGYLILRLVTKNYPADPGIKQGPYTINRDTRYISLRTRARQVSFRLEWASTKGFSARLGAIRHTSRPAGKRQ